MAGQPTLPKCAECRRAHMPGRLNTFDDGKREREIACTCEADCSELECTSTCSCTPCPNTRYYWHPHLYWTSPGGLHAQFESMYANGSGPYRCREGFAVDYETCTPAELKTFVKQRGLPDPYPEGLTLSYYYVKILDAADRSPPVFRFMDLPPEMRNLVYTNLLTIFERYEPSTFGGNCDPNILSTCRQVHREAADLPYANNTIKVYIHADWRVERASGNFGPTGKLIKTVQIHNEGVRDVEETEHEHIPNGITAWPDYLRRARKLSIEINLLQSKYDGHDHGGMEFAKNCLTTLTAFLMDKHCLNNLDVLISYPNCHALDGDDVLETLRRLKISGVVSIRGGGVETPSLVLDMKDDTRATPPNLIKEAKLGFDEADEVVAMHRIQEMSADREDDPEMRDVIAELLKCIGLQRGFVLDTLAMLPVVDNRKDTYTLCLLATLRNMVRNLRPYVETMTPAGRVDG